MKEEESKNIKSENQKINMVNMTYLNKVRKDHIIEAKEEDLMKYQDYLISALYTLNPPRRLEYANMLIIEYAKLQSTPIKERKERNYLVIKNNNLYFLFNNYKTVKSYGIQKIEIKNKLKEIIKDWIKINKSNYFLIGKNKKELSSNNLGKMIIRIFSNEKQPNIGLNILRHSYISSLFNVIENIDKRNKVSSLMAHSVIMQNQYIKKD